MNSSITFVPLLPLSPPRRARTHVRPRSIPGTISYHSPLCHIAQAHQSNIASASRIPVKSSAQPQSRTKHPARTLRNLAVALCAAAATNFLPLRQPAHAGEYSTGTTVARAVPRSSSLTGKQSRAVIIKHGTPPLKQTSSEPAHDSHGMADTPFAVAGSAAFLASSLAVAITHPIDTLKTKRQARASGKEDEDTDISLRTLYRGVFSNILKEAPNAAIYLGTYELFKTALLSIPALSATPLLAMCIAGMLGDGVGSIVRVPAEIVNKRLQLGLSHGWNAAIKDSFLSESGVEGTIASWAAVLWRDVPYGGIQIAGYEFVRLLLAGFGYTGLMLSVAAGAIAGLFAAVVTTPADVLVTRMSTQSPQCYLETHHYMSPSATFVRILKDEGFGALWTGAFHRGMFYMPMIGLFFAAYESFKYAIMNPIVLKLMVSKVLMTVLRLGVGTAGGFAGLFRTPFYLAPLVFGHWLVEMRKVRNASSAKS